MLGILFALSSHATPEHVLALFGTSVLVGAVLFWAERQEPGCVNDLLVFLLSEDLVATHMLVASRSAAATKILKPPPTPSR